ncbi:MAG TPA: protein kinase, partial [Phycisphaerae bacterium]
AISKLHASNVVHRDIKPSNVLLDAQGGLFVTDFGLACPRLARAPDGRAAAWVGTPTHMAPEMFEGEPSPRADIYALGIMTFELLTGTIPFAGGLEEVRRQHQQAPLPHEPLQRCGTDAQVIQVLERATRKEAILRFKSPEKFLAALLEASGEPAPSHPEREIAALVARCSARTRNDPQVEAPARVPSSYYDQLATRADQKRHARIEPRETASPVVETRGLDFATAPRLVVDLACLGCGYNLRGLAAKDVCPECGASVVSTLQNALVFSEPAWLWTTVRGITLTIAGIIGVLVSLLIPAAAFMRYVVPTVALTRYFERDLFAYLTIVLLTGASCAVAAGAILVGTRERLRRPYKVRFSSRHVAGILTTAAAGCALAGSVTLLIHVPTGATLCKIGFLLLCAGLGFLMLHLGRLAARVPVWTRRRWPAVATLVATPVAGAALAATEFANRAVARQPDGVLRPPLVLPVTVLALTTGISLLIVILSVPFVLATLVSYQRALRAVARSCLSPAAAFGAVAPPRLSETTTSATRAAMPCQARAPSGNQSGAAAEASQGEKVM